MASPWKRKFEEIDGHDDDDDLYGSEADMEEEDAEDWKASIDGVTQEHHQQDKQLRRLPTYQHTPGEEDTTRVIVHVDVDCFYAQVEMIRDPTLRDKPLGIQQKYLVVTCNYVARKRGVTKLMGIKQAMELCPDLVLVKGEDLTHYREMSYKITEVLQKFSPLVERLGFDENFIDVTEVVDTRLKSASCPSLNGHVFPEKEIEDDCRTADRHLRLAYGSQVAAEMRQALQSQLGITCCAGISHNKLLAKLVAGQHKPNQQTTLLPEGVQQLMGTLKSARKIPGIGHTTYKKLQILGVSSVQDLQDAPADVLEEQFGLQTALVMQQLCRGVDPSPVTPTGPPQTISDEDSFKKCTSLQNAKERMTGLLQSLMKRLRGDGRIPHVLRVTVRKLLSTNKWTNRESRQCAVPPHLFGTGDDHSKDEETILKLLDLCVVLFCKMVDVRHPFHLTLINICFAKLETRSRRSVSIKTFFQSEATATQTCQKSGYLQSDSRYTLSQQQHTTEGKSLKPSIENFFRPRQNTSSVSEVQEKSSGTSVADKVATCQQHTAATSATPGKSFFSMSREHVQTVSTKSDCRPSHLPSLASDNANSISNLNSRANCPGVQTELLSTAPETEPNPLCSVRTLPSGIDLEVFRQLPPEIQKEIHASFKEAEVIGGSGSTNQPHIDAKLDTDHENSALTGQSSCTSLHPEHEERVMNTSISGCTESKSTTVEDMTLPSDIDPSVFNELPVEMRSELLHSWQRNNSTTGVAQKERRPQAKKAGKSPSIAKYFKKMDG